MMLGMDAKTFYETFGAEEAEKLSIAAGTTLAYFQQIMYGFRKPSHTLTKKLEFASDGRISRYDLRPDIYGIGITQTHAQIAQFEPIKLPFTPSQPTS